VGFRAARAERAEATGVVWTERGDGGGISVEVEAVGGIGAGERAAVVRAVGHAASRISYQHQFVRPSLFSFDGKGAHPQIVFMQEFALLPLLAQSAQPMLAY